MNEKKFTSLTHHGVIFPPEYEPQGVQINGETLSPLAEEMLVAYASKKESPYVSMPKFNENFYKCFQRELPPRIREMKFPHDFMPIIEKIYIALQKRKEERNSYRREHMEEIKKEAEERKKFYGYAMLDGTPQPLGGYMIEPPGIFIGRGNSPLLGLWKYRVKPEDVAINYVSEDMSQIPSPPQGHHWGRVDSNTNVFHIAEYIENIGNVTQMVKELRFGNSSSVKAEADEKKFNMAIVLLQHMDEMTSHIQMGIKEPNGNSRRMECALISWLLQNTGIRIGKERNEEVQAPDVVGASTLKKENLWVENGVMHLRFIGKDSVPYSNEMPIPKYVEMALNKIRNKKGENEQLFKASAHDVAKFLSEVCPCTPKLFRTAIASMLMVEELRKMKIKKGWTVSQKLNAFNEANLAVAKKLNHQRNVSKDFSAQMEKMEEMLKVKEELLRETKEKVKKEMKKLDDKELSIKTHLAESRERDLVMKSIEEKRKALKERVKRAKERVEDVKMKMSMKDKSSGQALSTSKSNYLSPKLAFSFCKKYDIPIEKIYTKALLEKFSWAKDTDSSYFDLFPNVPMENNNE